MLKIFSNKKWESLIEIMIAVVVLTIVLISMSKILWNAKITAQSSEKRIEAVALAKEWLEIFRYYRKDNYMKYSDKKRICWNFVQDNNSAVNPVVNPFNWDWILDSNDSGCEESTTFTWSAKYYLQDNSFYIPIQNIKDETYWRFYLSDLWRNLTTDWNKKNNWKIVVDLADFQLCKNIETWLIMSCKSMLPAWYTFTKIPYFRVLKLEYVNSLWELCSGAPDINLDWISDCDTNIANTDNPKSLNQIKVTSSVIWQSWWWIQSVDLTTIFTDYEDRIDRES